jgi:hypothetical protein
MPGDVLKMGDLGPSESPWMRSESKDFVRCCKGVGDSMGWRCLGDKTGERIAGERIAGERIAGECIAGERFDGLALRCREKLRSEGVTAR